MVDSQVHGPVDGTEKCGTFLSGVFVTTLDRFCLPVAPVYVILKHRQGEDVVESRHGIFSPGQDDFDIFPIEV